MLSLFNIAFSIDLLVLLAIILLSMLVGFSFRYGQINKKNRRIVELEEDMRSAHAEVLSVQKEYCALESRIKDMPIPVIAMNTGAKEEETKAGNAPEGAGLRTNRPTRTA